MGDGPLFVFCEREWDDERQERGKLRQPTVLLVDLTRDYPMRGSRTAMLSPKLDRVVRPGRWDQHDGKLRLLRELRGDQPGRERGVGVYLARVHLFCLHNVLSH